MAPWTALSNSLSCTYSHLTQSTSSPSNSYSNTADPVEPFITTSVPLHSTTPNHSITSKSLLSVCLLVSLAMTSSHSTFSLSLSLSLLLSPSTILQLLPHSNQHPSLLVIIIHITPLVVSPLRALQSSPASSTFSLNSPSFASPIPTPAWTNGPPETRHHYQVTTTRLQLNSGEQTRRRTTRWSISLALEQQHVT
jgi:hypothetical protein